MKHDADVYTLVACRDDDMDYTIDIAVIKGTSTTAEKGLLIHSSGVHGAKDLRDLPYNWVYLINSHNKEATRSVPLLF
jgi:hypothetical protein